MVKIEFFFKGKSLGVSDQLIKHSGQSHRDTVAKGLNIDEYDEFILDDGRVHCKRAEGYLWTDHSVRISYTIKR